MGKDQIRDAPPASDHLTDYDRRHAKFYLRLLDADAEGADWREIVAVLFELDPDQPDTFKVYEANLKRAKWMTQVGYRELVGWGWPQ